MMIQNILQSSLLASTLLILSTSSIAGKLYRFPDENGVPTVSRSLPPSAAQKGYDILDDQSLRVLEHIAPALTEEEITALETQQQLEIEAQRQAEIAEQEEQKYRHKQSVNDQNLIASYATEQDLITSRDESIKLRQTKITEIEGKQPQLEQQLVSLQQQAADQEISVGKIYPNLLKRLDTSQQNISNNNNTVARLKTEITELTERYAADLIRLREILAVQATTAN